jgi:glycosyltransferase involved in cell wall biosynthesis
MKICHLTSVHLPTDTRIFIKECQSTVDEGYETHLVAPDAPNKAVRGINLHNVKKNKGDRFSRMTKTVLSVYQKAKEINADIYHFHDPELIPIGFLLKLKGKIVIYDVHEDVPRQILSKHWIPRPLRKLVSWCFEKLENYAAKRFDGVITATPFINNRFKSLNHFSVNVNNYPILRELHLPNIEWSNKERSVCYVGGITRIRGFFEMVEAIGLTDSKLLLCGGFSKESERIKVSQMDGWSNVNELGFLNRVQVAEIFSKSIAGLVLFHPKPNHVDAQPNKMFEYMSSGIPVIASNFPLWKEIIEGNQCGLCVNPFKPKEIAEAIQFFIDHPVVAERMGQNGRKAVEEQFNWEAESKKLIAMYKELEKKSKLV